MNVVQKIHLDEAMTTGAKAIWTPLVDRILHRASRHLSSGSRVLEIGYGNGLLSSYMAQTYNWSITGYEVSSKLCEQAKESAKRLPPENRPDFRVCDRTETRKLCGSYDALVIKTVIYASSSVKEYGQWLDWSKSVLKPGGIFINFESGLGTRSVRLYRKLRKREYVSSCMYNSAVERLYRQKFDNVQIEYHGGEFWFAGSSKRLYSIASRLDRKLFRLNADSCFVASIFCSRGEAYSASGASR